MKGHDKLSSFVDGISIDGLGARGLDRVDQRNLSRKVWEMDLYLMESSRSSLKWRRYQKRVL